eukprot:747339-Hanusia_phi.AAC.2
MSYELSFYLTHARQGILHTKAFEECNITAANKVKAVHLSFIEAGANIIETNTFGANKFALARYGLANVVEINQAGVKIAQVLYVTTALRQHTSFAMKEAVAESGKGTIIAGAVSLTMHADKTTWLDECHRLDQRVKEQVQTVAVWCCLAMTCEKDSSTMIRLKRSPRLTKFRSKRWLMKGRTALAQVGGGCCGSQLWRRMGKSRGGRTGSDLRCCGGDGEGCWQQCACNLLLCKRWERNFLPAGKVLACPNAGHPKR